MRLTRTFAATAGTFAAVALGLSGCGGSSSAASTAPSPSASRSTSSPGGSTPDRTTPGTTGKIAQVSAGSIEVQSATDQTTVTYTATTTITRTKKAALSDVSVGDCIVATSAATGSATTSPDPQSAVTATSIRISTPVNNTCGAGGFGRGQGFPGRGGFPGDGAGRPTTSPTARPDAGNPRQFGGFGAFGTVTAVSGSTITVKQSARVGGQSPTAAPTISPASTPTTTVRTITVTAATTYTTTSTGSAKDLVVGECATALGQAGSTGAVSARSIAVSDPVNGSCTTGFGGFGGRRPSAGGATTGNA